MRLDQWLWAVRLYKTRSLACEAIKGGHVRVNGNPAKPGHEVRPREEVCARIGIITRTLRVIDAPASRVGAKLVAQFAEDLTPPEEFERQRLFHLSQPSREPGAGRPTKRERRELDEMTDQVEF